MNIKDFFKFGVVKLLKQILKTCSYIVYNFSGHKRHNSSELNGLKDKYKGKRIFIICNGPSLRPEDLDSLAKNNEYTIASNKIDKIFQFTEWRPYFYTVLDDTFQYSIIENMLNASAKLNFFGVESYIKTKVVPNSVYLNLNRNPEFLNNPQFATEISKSLNTLGTVTFAMFEIARYLGFSEMYIIGCDNSYGKEIKKDGTIVDHGTTSYFKGASDKDNSKAVAATWQMNIAYEFAEKYSRENGFRIYNATRGGYLEAFERVDFDSILKE